MNTMKILEWEPEFPFRSDEDFSPELLLGHLCHVGVSSDMSAFRKRYAEVSKYDQHLRFAVAEPSVDYNLYGPLRQAKMNYILGNYTSSIALCGIVAELVTILTYILGEKPSNSRRKKIEGFPQSYRIEDSGQKGLISEQVEHSLSVIKRARDSLLHDWKKPDERIATKAADVYARATHLAFVTFFVNELRDGKFILRPEWMEYLEERGAIVREDEGE